ncbi:MAG: hypothetical protein RR619_06970, partial [Raoultibacter sp.]
MAVNHVAGCWCGMNLVPKSSGAGTETGSMSGRWISRLMGEIVDGWRVGRAGVRMNGWTCVRM